jgi:four helix bundle protein
MLLLEDLEVYQLAMEIGEEIWVMVDTWSAFAKDTIGKQLVRSADSIGANIAEGYGRYFYKENRQFCFYSRGSLMETKTWLQKAYHRKLIDEEVYVKDLDKLRLLHKKLNGYIKFIGKFTNDK